MSLSKIVISGRVIKNPEKRFTPNNNVAVTEFTIAVESPPRQDGKKETSPVKVISWRDLAERCAQEIAKGDLVAVDGRLQINQHTGADGQKKRIVEIDAVYVENLSRAGASESESSNSMTKATAGASVGASTSEDLDSIFASEDEIPF